MSLSLGVKPTKTLKEIREKIKVASAPRYVGSMVQFADTCTGQRISKQYKKVVERKCCRREY